MNEIRVGRLRRDRGISVARPTPLGNPFARAEYGREPAIQRFRDALPGILIDEPLARAQFDHIVAAARAGDVTLLCWCAPLPCHADVIADAVRAALRSP